MHISIIGTGYVGLVTGLCLADRGHRVTCVDIDAAKIARLAQGELPFHEAGLGDLLARHLGRRFCATTDLTQAVLASELTMITVGTPLENGAIGLGAVRDAARSIGLALARKACYHVVVVKSTVVPGTTEDCVRPILEEASGKKVGIELGLGTNPEFLREGEAIEDFQQPDRIVIGGIDSRSLVTIAQLYQDFPNTQQVRTNCRTAEMIKYASNALLATLISFSNEIGNLCSAMDGIDVLDVQGAVHLDKRISPITPDGRRVIPPITAYLKAGCGFGGSCFPKDLRALINWGRENNQSAQLLTAVMETNDGQADHILNLLGKHFERLTGIRVAVLGLAFKPGTDDIRESPALRVIPALVAEGAEVVAYDPIAVQPARLALGTVGIEYAESLEEAVAGADAVVLITAWPEFQRVPELLDSVGVPAVVVDGRRVLDKGRLLRYEGIGLGRSVKTAPILMSLGEGWLPDLLALLPAISSFTLA